MTDNDQYKVILSADLSTFLAKVNYNMGQGWVPFGDVAVVPGVLEHMTKTEYLQSMVKYGPQTR